MIVNEKTAIKIFPTQTTFLQRLLLEALPEGTKTIPFEKLGHAVLGQRRTKYHDWIRSHFERQTRCYKMFYSFNGIRN